MKTILLLFLCLLSSPGARAELALYNFTGKIDLAGSGFTATIRQKGVLVWDVDSGQAWQLAAFTTGGSKRLVVADQSASRLFQSQSATKTYTAVVGQTATNSGTITTESSSFTFGMNAELTLRPGRTIVLPRVARNTGFAINQVNATGLTVMGPASGTYSFSSRQTVAANTAGLTAAAAIDQWRVKYQALGYLE